MPKTIYMFRGLPGSGKSTRAKQMLAEFGKSNAHRVNKDELRAMLDNGEWSPSNEKFVLEIRDHIVTRSLAEGKHALVDDCNLPEKHEARLRQLAKENGAAFEIIDFTDVPLEECIERDLKRSLSVGESVIRGMYNQFLRKAETPPAYDLNLPDAMIVDIDGTVAQMNGRGPFEWDHVGEDLPRSIVIEIARQRWISTPTAVVFLSGRDSVCREQTQKWLNKYWGTGSDLSLWMRPNGDMRKDAIVKRELYEAYVKDKFNVVAIFDDRAQICREWDRLGFGDRLFRVGRIDGDDF